MIKLIYQDYGTKVEIEDSNNDLTDGNNDLTEDRICELFTRFMHGIGFNTVKHIEFVEDDEHKRILDEVERRR